MTNASLSHISRRLEQRHVPPKRWLPHRAAIKGKKENIADYDVVFIGYPIWWDLAPRIIDTFIESHDLKGKTVVPFATSGGSTLAGSAAALEKAYPTLNWKEGQLLNRADEKTVRTWIEKLGF